MVEDDKNGGLLDQLVTTKREALGELADEAWDGIPDGLESPVTNDKLLSSAWEHGEAAVAGQTAGFPDVLSLLLAQGGSGYPLMLPSAPFKGSEDGLGRMKPLDAL